MITFRQFQTKLNRRVSQSGNDTPVLYLDDTEKGLFTAIFPDGMRITTRPTGKWVDIRMPGMHKREAIRVPIESL